MKHAIFVIVLFLLFGLFFQATLAVEPAAGAYYTIKTGDWTLTALSDVQGNTGPVSLLNNAPEELVKQLFPNGQMPLDVNAFLLQNDEHTVLIDTGNGQPAGRVLQSLEAYGVEPEEVDTILLTHFHPDHILGLLQDGETPLYPNAIIYTPIIEHIYWYDDDAMARAPQQAGTFSMVRRILGTYGDRVKQIHERGRVHEIIAVPAYGHTPGHTAYFVKDTGINIFIWGDLMHCLPVQIRHPEVTLAFDMNPDMAAATRKTHMDTLAAEHWLVAGMHLPYPGLGYISKADGEYNFQPIEPESEPEPMLPAESINE